MNMTVGGDQLGWIYGWKGGGRGSGSWGSF